jgi:hypothetical protein
MRLSTEVKYSSPCSKSSLIKGLQAYAEKQKLRTMGLQKFNRNDLIEMAGDAGILLDLEERTEIIKVLRGVNICFDVNEGTYELVEKAIMHALERYGVADLESLRKNLRFSRILKIK